MTGSTLEAKDNNKKTWSLPSRRLSKLFQQETDLSKVAHSSSHRDSPSILSPLEAELDNRGLGIQGRQSGSDAMS